MHGRDKGIVVPVDVILLLLGLWACNIILSQENSLGLDGFYYVLTWRSKWGVHDLGVF